MAKFLDYNGLQRFWEKLQSWLTPANVGAAAASHKHAAGDITSGTLPVARGGTGATAIAGSGGFLQDLFPSSRTPTFIPCFGTNWTLNGYTTPSAPAWGYGTGYRDGRCSYS